MVNGLYLNNTWVAEVDISLNLQMNDLSKPDTLNSTYSLSFELPDFLSIRDLLENAEQIDAGGKYPYQTLSAKLVDEGNVVFTGLAKLISFQGGWKVTLYAATVGLFDKLSNLNLRQLDLARYDHNWTTPVISSLAGSVDGVVYPLIDYGSYDNGVFASDALSPAVYAHTLIQQMLTQVGYQPDGDWLSEVLIKRIALPFVDDSPQSRDQDWVSDRTAFVTVATPIISPQTFDAIIPFSVDNQEPIYMDGKLNNFKATLYAYQCDVAMRLKVQASQQFTVYIGSGAIEAMLICEKNGVNVAQAYFSVSGPYNVTGTRLDTLTLNETINCRAGDQIRIRFVFQKRTFFADWQTVIAIEPEKTWASFTPDPTVYPGDDWPVAQNLPDLTCLDLLKTIALMTSSTYQVNEFRRTIKLIPLDSILANTANAVDWSSRVEESQEPELLVTLEPYGQANKLKWKTLEKISTYGDGVVKSTAANLPLSTDLFELPFAACLDSDKFLNGYGNLVQILTRTLSTSNGSTTVQKQATSPRLILIEPSATTEVKANVLTTDNTVQEVVVTLTGCWWAKRSFGVVTPDNAFSLAFDKVDALQREQTLIQRYFSGLFRILRRPRLLSVSMMLEPDDIASLDLTLPIRLRKVRAGSLQLNDGFYYLNKISNYTGDQPCIVSLIPYF